MQDSEFNKEKDFKSDYLNYYHTKKIRFLRFSVFATLLFSAVVIGGIFAFQEGGGIGESEYIAEIAIDGIIEDVGLQVEKIRTLKNDDTVKAVIIAVNSPGGTTYDSEVLYDAIRFVAEKKPVVTYMKNIAASGGYIVSLAGEKIYGAKNTITGSIGVLMQVPKAKALMDKIGVSMLEIKSSPIKGEPNYFSDTPQAAIDNLQSMIDDTDIWFSDLVKERRTEINPENFARLTNGSVYTGTQAVQNKLIDAIGGQSQAKAYLIQTHKLDKNIEVKPFSIEPENTDALMDTLLGSMAGYFSRNIQNIFPIHRNKVDGLLSLWHS